MIVYIRRLDMYLIKNICDKDIVIQETVDTSVKGCRLADQPLNPTTLKPEETMVVTGYEPGVSVVITPADEPDKYQRYEDLHTGHQD